MNFLTKTAQDYSAKFILTFVFEDEKNNSKLFEKLNLISNNELSKQIYAYKTIKGNFLDCLKYSINAQNKVLICGLGKKEELSIKKISQAVANAARIIKSDCEFPTLGVEVINPVGIFDCVPRELNSQNIIQTIITALRIGLYDFDKYKKHKDNKIHAIELICDNITPEIEKGAEIGAYTSFAMKFAKDLVNESAQIVTPDYVAKLAQEIANEHRLEANIYDKKEIYDLKMNAFLAVGQGSIHTPRFVHLIYKPKNTTPTKKVALIGKGITFDAGGMNIKPAASMLTMKSDMTGAATVLGIIQAIAKLRPPIELHCITALCENMTSGSAYKQGDVLTAKNGVTIEVDNTDAEGRLTLADALCYADTLGVDEVIDIATLTGAAIVSLGHNITAVLGNNQNQINEFMEVSKIAGENTWQMPIFDELKENLKSEIADMKNTGGRNAGTSTAGWFLSNFTKNQNWLHLDIAGTAYLDKSNKETLFGPTGVMIRTLINYLIK